MPAQSRGLLRRFAAPPAAAWLLRFASFHRSHIIHWRNSLRACSHSGLLLLGAGTARRGDGPSVSDSFDRESTLPCRLHPLAHESGVKADGARSGRS